MASDLGGRDLAVRRDLAVEPDLAVEIACDNRVQDGDETDRDCGGPMCPQCAAGQRCARDRDCTTGHCNNTICGGPPASFAAPRDYPVGQGPVFLLAADLDGDKDPDLAVANNSGSEVTILLNQGNGTFKAGTPLPCGSAPSVVAAGDLDADGRLDVVVATASTVAFFLGNGDGTFKANGTVNSCQGLRWVAVGELTGDSALDVAEACVGFPPFNSLKTLSILAGDGTGAIAGSRTIPCDDGPAVVLAADVNRDQKTDLVISSGLNRVSSLVGDGKGGFAAAAPTMLVNYAPAITLGDLNADGLPDVVTAELVVNNNVEALLGNGDGTFRKASQQTSGVGPRAVTLGDFNHDGALDFAAASTGLLMNPDMAVRLFLGDGKGGFNFATTLAAGKGPDAVATADFNGDGKDDLAIANGTDNTVSVLLNSTK